MSGNNPFLVIGDPDGVIKENDVATATIRLGFAQYGQMVICLAKSSAFPARMVESPRLFLDGDTPPEINISDGDHILWQMVTVSKGVVINIRAFTTSPSVTTFLRRVFAEQRAHGSVSVGEADKWISAWQRDCPTVKDAWGRVVVSCLGGD
jgi:hypothetical protein